MGNVTMTKQVGIFKGSEDFRDNFIANLVYQSCIHELLVRSNEIRRTLRQADALTGGAGDLSRDLLRCESEIEKKWEQASLLYDGLC